MSVRPITPQGGSEEDPPVERVEPRPGVARYLTPQGGAEDDQQPLERVIGGA